jgi:hypothetical protein
MLTPTRDLEQELVGNPTKECAHAPNLAIAASSSAPITASAAMPKRRM